MPYQLHNGRHDSPGIDPGKQQHQKEYHRPQHGQTHQHHRPDLLNLRSHHRQQRNHQTVRCLLHRHIVYIVILRILNPRFQNQHAVRINMKLCSLILIFLLQLLCVQQPDLHRQLRLLQKAFQNLPKLLHLPVQFLSVRVLPAHPCQRIVQDISAALQDFLQPPLPKKNLCRKSLSRDPDQISLIRYLHGKAGCNVFHPHPLIASGFHICPVLLSNGFQILFHHVVHIKGRQHPAKISGQKRQHNSGQRQTVNQIFPPQLHMRPASWSN